MDDSSDFTRSDSDKSDWDAFKHCVSNPVEADFNNSVSVDYSSFLGSHLS
jgi:hypothetical protein